MFVLSGHHEWEIVDTIPDTCLEDPPCVSYNTVTVAVALKVAVQFVIDRVVVALAIWTLTLLLLLVLQTTIFFGGRGGG